MELQTIKVYKLDPNIEELNGDVEFGKTIHGRVFYNVCVEIKNDNVILKNSDEEIVGIFSLKKCYVDNSSR